MAEPKKSEIRNDMRAFNDKGHLKRARWDEVRRILGQALAIAILIGIAVGLWMGASAIMGGGEEEPTVPPDEARDGVNYL